MLRQKQKLKQDRKAVLEAMEIEYPYPPHRRHRLTYMFNRIQSIDAELYRLEVANVLSRHMPYDIGKMIADMAVETHEVTIQKKLSITCKGLD